MIVSPHPEVALLSHHPARWWAPSRSQGCCGPACPLVAYGSASRMGGQEEFAKNENVSLELGFELNSTSWTLTSGCIA